MTAFVIVFGLITVGVICAITAVVLSIIHMRAVTRQIAQRIEENRKQIDFTYEEWVESIERARKENMERARNEMQSRIDSTYH